MVATVSNLTQLQNFAGASRSVLVTDKIVGGIFNHTFDVLEADGQNIIPADGIGENQGYWVKEEASNGSFPFNNMHIPTGATPVIVPTAGQDELIREIGKPIYDPNTEEYVLVYSGSVSPYTGDNGKIFRATSPDLEVWTKQGAITGEGFEDPSLLIVGENYRLTAEKKSGATHLGIAIFEGTDITALVENPTLLLEAVPDTWCKDDVSSPEEKIIDGVYYVFFEGRATTSFDLNGETYARNDGAIGYATSATGEAGTYIIGNGGGPIIFGYQLGNDTWFTHIVSDSALDINNRSYLTTHAFNGSNFVCGVFDITNVDSPTDALNTWLTIDKSNNDQAGNGVMLIRKGNGVYAFNCMSNSEGIYQGTLSVRASNNLRYTSRTAATNVNLQDALAASGKNEIMKLAITSNQTLVLRSDLSSGAGFFKIVDNDTAYVATIDPDTGVTINGGTSNFIMGAGVKALWYLAAADTWEMFNLTTPESLAAALTAVGLGSSAVVSNDWNVITQTGFYFNDSGAATGIPTGAALINLQHIETSSGGATQLAIRVGSDNMWWRRRTSASSSAWQTWVAVASTTYADAKVADNLTASTTVAPSKTAVNTALASKAPLASPALTGTPTAPTAAAGTNTTQVATAAFVTDAVTTGVAFATAYTDAEIVARHDDYELVNNSITTVQTASDLNTLYPSAPIRFKLYCPEIGIGGARAYIKVNATDWMEIIGTKLTP